jgi:hypothetical protein
MCYQLQKQSLKTSSLRRTNTFQNANAKDLSTPMRNVRTTNGKQAGRQFATIIFRIGATLTVICILATIAMILLEAIYQLKR